MKSSAYLRGALTATVVGCAAWVQAQPAGGSLTPAQRMELEMLRGQLADPTRTARTKRDAATLLLNRSYPQASAVLRDFLADNSNRPAQIAVAEAVAQSGRTHRAMIRPLLAMLTGPEPSVRAPAARALATFKDHGVLDELQKIVTNRQGDRAIRLVIISAMQRMVDRQAVDVLVGLLDDPGEGIRNAACDALGRLTNIRAFGRDTARWKLWWKDNRTRPRGDWLAELANSLARTNLALESENTELRARLARLTADLYAATPPAGRDALLESMLKDTLAEIRLAGARLTRQRLTGGGALPESLRAAVRARVTDPHPGVRREAVLLMAGDADKKTIGLLAARLKAEKIQAVRVAIYQALRLRGDPAAWELLVAGIATGSRAEAVAAAAGLARVAAKNHLADARRTAAVTALTARAQAAGEGHSEQLREALLEAMGALKDKRLAGLMTAALTDPAAPVRLSALKGLAALAAPESAAAMAALVADPDPSVRLAAIEAIGALGGPKNIDAILARTDPAVEPDAAVRRQAWSVVMTLLGKADTARIAALAKALAKREDDRQHYIEVLKLWAEKVPDAGAAEWVEIHLHLGEALLSADRPAEAARQLQAVHAALVKAKDARAPAVWLKMIEAMLAADDTSVAGMIAAAPEAEHRTKAIDALARRLADLQRRKDWENLARMAQAALERLRDKLPEERRKAVEQARAEARTQQRLADRRRVAQLVERLIGPDEAARGAAAAELAAMKARSVRPLIEELRNVLRAAKPDPAAEKAIREALASVAPKLTGYDAAAKPAERLKTVEGWLRELDK